MKIFKVVRNATAAVPLVHRSCRSINFFLSLMLAFLVAMQAGAPSFAADEQSESNSIQCGQYAVYNVAALHGIPLELPLLEQIMLPASEGHSLADLKAALEILGFTAQGRKADKNRLESLECPFIAHLKEHFVVVAAVTDDTVLLYDRLSIPSTVSVDQFKAEWDGLFLSVKCPSKSAVAHALEHLSGAAPMLTWDSLIKDGGIIVDPPPSQSMSFDFTLRNVARKEVEIRRVRTDCKCAIAETPEGVGPGESATIFVSYAAGTGVGPFAHRVFVETSDPAFPVAMLTLSGEVHRNAMLKPEFLDMGVVPLDSEGERTAYLYCAESIESIALEEVEPEGPSLSVSVSPVTRESAGTLLSQPSSLVSKTIEHRYLVRLKANTAGLPQGFSTGIFHLKVNSPDGPSIAVPYRLKIVAPVVSRPRSVFLGLLESHRPIRGEVVLQLSDGEDFRILSASTEIAAMEVRCSSDISPENTIQYSYSPGETVQTVDGNIRLTYVRSASADPKSFDIPVYGYAPPKSVSQGG